jgi:hypothetical protein
VGAIERDVADRALTVRLANETSLEFVSRRVGNVVPHPVWSLLYSQVWVR